MPRLKPYYRNLLLKLAYDLNTIWQVVKMRRILRQQKQRGLLIQKLNESEERDISSSKNLRTILTLKFIIGQLVNYALGI